MNKQQHDTVISTVKLNVECFLLLNGDNLLFGIESFSPKMEKVFLELYQMEVLRLTK